MTAGSRLHRCARTEVPAGPARPRGAEVPRPRHERRLLPAFVPRPRTDALAGRIVAAGCGRRRFAGR